MIRNVRAYVAAGLVATALMTSHFAATAWALRPRVTDVITVRVTNFAFLSLPKRVTAGQVTIRLVNEGTKLHHLQLIRLAPGMTLGSIYADFVKGFALPAATHAAGGPSAAWGGQTIESTVTLAPGRYAVLCWVPAPDGTLHLKKGMMGEIEVAPAPAKSAAADVAVDVTLTTRDYAFQFSTPITRGRRTIRVVNAGPQAHEVVLVRLAPGRTADEARDWSERGQEGPPPGVMLNGSAALAVGASSLITNDFTPGRYAVICFMPDTRGRSVQPHAHVGMLTTFTVR